MNQRHSEIADYFEGLCNRHKEIKEFGSYELDELLSNSCFKQFPALALEGFDYDFSGSKPDNILKNRNGAFCVVTKCDVANSRERMNTLDHIDTIAEQILMKMVADKRACNPLLTNFEIASAEGIHFANPALGIVFCRVNFSMKTKLSEDLTVWE